MHALSIPDSRPSRKRSLSIPLLVSAVLCFSLIASATITLVEVIRYKQLELDALQVLIRWQNMDTLTNDVLLKRVSLSDGGASILIREWERQSLDFSLALAKFNDRRKLKPFGDDMVADIHGAAELWGYTERRISAAQSSIRTIISSGLGSRVMVNGFLSTFYRLRLEGLLAQDEIVRIGDIVANLEVLDTTTEQFGLRLEAAVTRVGREVDERILRIAILSIVLALTIGILAIFLILAYRRFRREDSRRRKQAARLRRDYLRDLYSRLTDTETAATALRELGATLPFSRDLVLGFFRYDRSDGRRSADSPERLMELLERIPDPPRELFPVEDDVVAAIIKVSDGDDAASAFADRARLAAEAEGRTLSVALSERFDGSDGREGGINFDALRALFHYRYIYGPRAFLKAAALPPRREGTYEYPSEGEELIIKRVMEGKLDELRSRIDGTIEAACAYTPATVRAVVARLSSTLFSAIERLERAVSFTLPSASADSLAEIVQLDTVSDARDRFAQLLSEIGIHIALHQGQRTNAQLDRVDAIVKTAFADPNLSLELIADRLALSAGYLGRVYRKMRGRSVADAINDQRLDAARALLKDTNSTIEAIAAEVGIMNAGSLYRLFKARFGLTPSEHREKARFASADS